MPVPQNDDERQFVDPLLRTPNTPPVPFAFPPPSPASLPTRRLPPPGTTQARSSTTARGPSPHRRKLRMAGAAGMTSLLAMTGYITAGAGSSSSGVDASTDTVGGAVGIAAGSSAGSPAAPEITKLATAAPDVTSTSAPAPVCTSAYSIVSGDSWIRVANEASVPVEELYAVNNATAQTALFPGQSVCLPNGAIVVVAVPVPATTVPAPVTTAAPRVVVVPAPPAPKPHSKSGGS